MIANRSLECKWSKTSGRRLLLYDEDANQISQILRYPRKSVLSKVESPTLARPPTYLYRNICNARFETTCFSGSICKFDVGTGRFQSRRVPLFCVSYRQSIRDSHEGSDSRSLALSPPTTYMSLKRAVPSHPSSQILNLPIAFSDPLHRIFQS